MRSRWVPTRVCVRCLRVSVYTYTKQTYLVRVRVPACLPGVGVVHRDTRDASRKDGEGLLRLCRHWAPQPREDHLSKWGLKRRRPNHIQVQSVTMFTLSTKATLTQVVCGKKKTMKKFKKFGRRMTEQRRADLQRMTDRFRDLAQEETRRTKQLFDEHREFFVDDDDGDDDDYTMTSQKPINFFEK